jgi:hypothetical protein
MPQPRQAGRSEPIEAAELAQLVEAEAPDAQSLGAREELVEAFDLVQGAFSCRRTARR